MTDGATSVAPSASAMVPVPFCVRSRVVESPDSATLCLEPVGEALRSPEPGEFMMLYAFGVGEVAISISGDPTVADGSITHTIRAVGAVSRALRDAQPGTVVGVRGPFGTTWGLAEATGRDLVMVAGGVGLCPLRPAVLGALAQRTRYGKLTLVAGARSRADFVFAAQLEKWAKELQIELLLIVDAPTPGWSGEVGLVTAPLSRLALKADRTTAFLCGPEPMLRFGAEALMAKGVAAHDIRVSLERNMQCGIGWCGHCQLGPLLLCRDGPVVGYDVAGPLLQVREL
ncbi:FAD/NAD(P)-binding protein [Mycobacterium sp.]|uniref:FAD/NAD(P)-binding protein n=1 Tax=Mycobacterium sp. TaxID=1785 RepID=UPI003BB0C517